MCQNRENKVILSFSAFISGVTVKNDKVKNNLSYSLIISGLQIKKQEKKFVSVKKKNVQF